MPVPVINVAQMREWENASWAARRTQSEVISRVGHVLTAYVEFLTRPGDPILILAGKGHNGDDARQVVLNLTDREVTPLLVTDPQKAIREFNSLLSFPPSLIVEGVFGIGLRGPLDGTWIRLINGINRADIPVLSVDVPAGLNADSGEPMGAAVRASYTFTLGAPKRGLLAPHAARYVGRLVLAPDIGLVPCPHRSEIMWVQAEDFDSFPPPRPDDGHKGTFGHALIVSGSLGYHGAAVLATNGALRARPGLVSTVVSEDVYLPVAAQLRAAMAAPWHTKFHLPKTATAVLVGPGLADPDLPVEMRSWLRTLWKGAPQTVIVDASALDWVPTGKAVSTAPRILTPHPGEAARLLGTTTDEIQADRPSALRRLSRRYGGCWVVLKGRHTLVGRAKGEIQVNSSGNPLLAQGGSGDVLAGFLAGLLAQPHLAEDPARTLRYGVWQHGATADRLNLERSNWTVDNLLDRLGDRSTLATTHR